MLADPNPPGRSRQTDLGSSRQGAALPSLRRRTRLRARRWALVAVLAGGLALELAGRQQGLHQPIIYEQTAYGYRVVPNQDLVRFENRSFYNAQGMRSEAISVAPVGGTLRVLCLGDSVTNGGAITDQADTYPYQLQALLPGRLGKVEVLNASAPGWAVGNELGWLRSNGIFGSHYVVLALSTHDLFQEPAPSSIVGSHQSFPETRPYLAVQDLLHHYLVPMLLAAVGLSSDAGADPGVADRKFSEAQAARNRAEVLLIEDVVREQGGRLVVMFLDESMPPHSDEAAVAARTALFTDLASRGVPVLTLRAELAHFDRSELFRDAVHPNPVGNRVIAGVIARYISGAASPPNHAGPSAPVAAAVGR
jgi:hypothetical protein